MSSPNIKRADPYLALAKKAVETYVKTGKTVKPERKYKPFLKTDHGVFVSLHLKDGSLRGCIGTPYPVGRTVEEQIIGNAISAAAFDPRFEPITERELPTLVYSVDILSKPKRVTSVRELDPVKYGVIVADDYGRDGLLLPDLEGVTTVDQQIEICKRKAGIFEGAHVNLFSFTVERHK